MFAYTLYQVLAENQTETGVVLPSFALPNDFYELALQIFHVCVVILSESDDISENSRQNFWSADGTLNTFMTL